MSQLVWKRHFSEGPMKKQSTRTAGAGGKSARLSPEHPPRRVPRPASLLPRSAT